MNMSTRTILTVTCLLSISGCVAYAPPPMAAPYGMAPAPYGMAAPYGGYGYGVAPIVPVPVFGGGWWRGGFRR